MPSPDRQYFNPIDMFEPDPRILSEKLQKWKDAVDNGLEEDNLLGYQKEFRRKPTSSFQTPPLFDVMNPPQYWKGLADLKLRDISQLDRFHHNNAQYWELRYRQARDNLESLQQNDYDPRWKTFNEIRRLKALEPNQIPDRDSLPIIRLSSGWAGFYEGPKNPPLDSADTKPRVPRLPTLRRSTRLAASHSQRKAVTVESNCDTRGSKRKRNVENDGREERGPRRKQENIS